MKLADKKGAEAIAALGGLLEPLGRILQDEKIRTMFKNNASKAEFGSYVLKNHTQDVLEILAVRDGENPETYNPSFTEIPAKIMDLLTDDSFLMLFPSQAQNVKPERSGSVKGNTKARKK